MPSKIKPNLYDVPSFTAEGASYVVNVEASSCTCPHWEFRLKGTKGLCKHVKAARAARFTELLSIAEEQPTDALENLLPRYEAAGRIEVCLAVRSVLMDRAAAVV